MWNVHTWSGSARDFHASDLVIDTALWQVVVDAPAIVIGSSQSELVIDADSARASGYDVVHRRTGGGAVLVNDSALWVDLTLPRDHRWWVDDVSKSMLWLGRAWVSTLQKISEIQGTSEDLPEMIMHEGAMVRNALSDDVCFAGVAPGEVLVNNRKLVGISQRRSREGARFQCVVYRHWDASWLCHMNQLRQMNQLNNSVEIVAACGLDDIGIHASFDDLVTGLSSVLNTLDN